MAIYLSNPCFSNIKNLNKRLILDMIRFTPGGISRAEVARQMELTRAAISAIVDDFLGLDLVREAEDGPTTGGRRPIMLEINPQRGYVAGVDIGATHLGLVITDFAAHLIREVEYEFDIRQTPERALNEIDARLRELVAAAGLRFEQVLAIGVGVPGPVVAETGTVSVPPIMPGWDNFPIRSRLEALWQIPVSLNNDAELGALGEWAYGAGRGERHLAYIKVGSGVGAGLLLDGRIYRGVTGCAGEIGHITMLENGPLCSCGNHGCLEAMAGGAAIARKGQEAVRAGKRTQLAAVTPVENVTAKEVTSAARLGDLVAQQIIAEAGSYLGIAIAGVVNLFNPGMIIIGGGISQMGDLLLEPLRQTVRERSLRSAGQAVRITSAMLGRRSSGMGAIVQAVNAALHQITEC